jgi:hypothetical protein
MPTITKGTGHSMSPQVRVAALSRGGQHYIFLFDEANRTETLRTLGRMAANPELDFSWYDAAVLSQKIRDMPCNPLFNLNTSTNER